MKLLLGIFIIFFSIKVMALEFIAGRVTTLEPTYMPGLITFVLDTGNATCPAGKWLRWEKAAENNKAVYSTLLAALASQKPVVFIINDGDTNCSGQFLHLSK